MGPRCSLHPDAPTDFNELSNSDFRIVADGFLAAHRIAEVVRLLGPKHVFLADRGELSRGRAFYMRVSSFLNIDPSVFPSSVEYHNVASDAPRSTEDLQSEVLFDRFSLRR